MNHFAENITSKPTDNLEMVQQNATLIELHEKCKQNENIAHRLQA